MRKISIRDLHLSTGQWVRTAGSGERVIITDRGRPVATLARLDERDVGTPFAQRRTLPEFEALPPVAGDSSKHVSSDRDRG